MGLYDKLIDKALTSIFSKKLEKDFQGAVNQGLMSQEDADRAVSEFRSGSGGSNTANSGTSKINCCSTCEYFGWGECWYYYEGNPGFNYSKYYRFDYHGETQKIDYPNNSICDNFRRNQ